MKLGFVSSILDGWCFEEVVDFASAHGFACIEMACWPNEGAERRYAGVTHIDVAALDAEKAKYIMDYCRSKNVAISALAYYPNTLDSNPDKRAKNIAHLKKVIDASQMLGVNLVTTFIGRDQYQTVDENLVLVRKVWPELLWYAADRGVKIAIENCPMLFGADQWPGGQNLMTTPVIWNQVFDILRSDNIGINYDPSHFVWQRMDYIAPIYEFKDKIFHVHYKDIKLYPEKLKRVGTMAYPLDYMCPKLPGLGDVNWAQYVSALTDIGYQGYSCIEVEDKAFEGSKERIEHSLLLSQKYLQQYVI